MWYWIQFYNFIATHRVFFERGGGVAREFFTHPSALLTGQLLYSFIYNCEGSGVSPYNAKNPTNSFLFKIPT